MPGRGRKGIGSPALWRAALAGSWLLAGCASAPAPVSAPEALLAYVPPLQGRVPHPPSQTSSPPHRFLVNCRATSPPSGWGVSQVRSLQLSVVKWFAEGHLELGCGPSCRACKPSACRRAGLCGDLPPPCEGLRSCPAQAASLPAAPRDSASASAHPTVSVTLIQFHKCLEIKVNPSSYHLKKEKERQTSFKPRMRKDQLQHLEETEWAAGTHGVTGPQKLAWASGCPGSAWTRGFLCPLGPLLEEQVNSRIIVKRCPDQLVPMPRKDPAIVRGLETRPEIRVTWVEGTGAHVPSRGTQGDSSAIYSPAGAAWAERTGNEEPGSSSAPGGPP